MYVPYAGEEMREDVLLAFGLICSRDKHILNLIKKANSGESYSGIRILIE